MVMTQEKGKRGRKKGVSNLVIIKDDLMKPYYIQKDRTNYSVMKESNGIVDNFVGHYTAFPNALRTIIKAKFESKKNNYTSLKEYIDEYKTYVNKFEEIMSKLDIV
jgi:hypothetical protein